jgi:tetratricopeptide (TPR) repeat protein
MGKSAFSRKGKVIAAGDRVTPPASPAPAGMPSTSWQSCVAWLASLEGPRKLAINSLVCTVTVLGALVVGKAAWQQVYLIEPIGVPKELEAQGYTPVSVGQRIVDEVTEINRTASMTKQTGIYVLSEADPRDPDVTDFQTPGRIHLESSFSLSSNDESKKYDVSVGGVSLNTVVLYIREILGRSDTKISGDITVVARSATDAAGKNEGPAAKKFSIRLRITDKDLIQEALATDDLDALFKRAALKVVERFDPLQAAYYSYYKQDYDNALRLARAYLVDETKSDKQFALNVIGLVKHARYRHDEKRVGAGYDSAIEHFTELTTSEPKFTQGLYNLAHVLIDKGLKERDDEEAHKLFSRAYKLTLTGIRLDEANNKFNDRTLAVGYATVGSALRHMAQRDPAKYDEALDYFGRSVKKDPMFIYAYLSQGSIHSCRGALEKANEQYRLATELSPSNQTFTRVGALLRQYDHDGEAVEWLQRAADLKPSAVAYTYWGMAERDAGNYEDAAKRFKQAIEQDPKVPNAYNQLGVMYFKQGKWAEAEAQFRAAADADPNWTNYQYNIARALYNAGKVKDALAVFQQASTIYQNASSKELGKFLEQAKASEEADKEASESAKTPIDMGRAEKQSCAPAAVALSMANTL